MHFMLNPYKSYTLSSSDHFSPMLVAYVDELYTFMLDTNNSVNQKGERQAKNSWIEIDSFCMNYETK